MKISSLHKLSDIRSNKPGLNLLHYVAGQVEEANPDLLTLPDDLAVLEEASKWVKIKQFFKTFWSNDFLAPQDFFGPVETGDNKARRADHKDSDANEEPKHDGRRQEPDERIFAGEWGHKIDEVTYLCEVIKCDVIMYARRRQEVGQQQQFYLWRRWKGTSQLDPLFTNHSKQTVFANLAAIMILQIWRHK